jgi:hypothetical protein
MPAASAVAAASTLASTAAQGSVYTVRLEWVSWGRRMW